MHDDEQDEIGREQEMRGARRLPAAKEREQPWESGVDRWRHCEPGEDQDRKGDDDAEISELLQHVVMQRLVAFGKSEPRVIDDCPWNRPYVGCARPEVANMTPPDEVGEIDEPVEHENPGEEEMPP